MDARLDFVDAHRAVGDLVEPGKRIPAAPPIDALDDPTAPVEVARVPGLLVEPQHRVDQERPFPAVVDAVPGDLRMARERLPSVLRGAHRPRPELRLAGADVGDEVIPQRACGVEGFGVIPRLGGRQQAVQQEVEFVGFHAAQRGLVRPDGRVGDAQVSARLLGRDQPREDQPGLFLQGLVARHATRQRRRFQPFARLLADEPPVAIRLRLDHARVAVDVEDLEIAITVGAEAPAHEPADLPDGRRGERRLDESDGLRGLPGRDRMCEEDPHEDRA